MAEAHPVGFQWVMEAKARGAKIIHVDPRFTRTSAVADLHVPLRAGSDIAFLGGLVNYVLTEGKEFRDYVVAYTNAGAILREDYADTEDLDGLFSGFDAESRSYDTTTWQTPRPRTGTRPRRCPPSTRPSSTLVACFKC
jgi:formate dehydrogenase major subunit